MTSFGTLTLLQHILHNKISAFLARKLVGVIQHAALDLQTNSKFHMQLFVGGKVISINHC
jgi:hypothetical protein